MQSMCSRLLLVGYYVIEQKCCKTDHSSMGYQLIQKMYSISGTSTSRNNLMEIYVYVMS